MNNKNVTRLLRSKQGDWVQVQIDDDDQSVIEHRNAVEAHMKSQSDIPAVMRDPISEAEFNSRFNGGDIAPIAAIDGDEKLIEVPEGLEQQELFHFLWSQMIQADGDSIRFAFATDKEGLCVTYLSRAEGYVAQASLEIEEGEVRIGDWRVKEIEKKAAPKHPTGARATPTNKNFMRRKSPREKIRRIRRRRMERNCMPRPLRPRHSHLEDKSDVAQEHCTRAERVPRNKPCPCGSGRKSKNCCGAKTKDRSAQSCKTATPVPQQDGCSGDVHCQDGHRWVVFSTAIADGCLTLNCTACGAMGTVDNPSRDEWAAAYEAPSKPYRWMDNSRVRFRQAGPVYVERWSSSPTVGKVIASESPLTERERDELETLEGLVIEGQLDGQLFPLFIQGFQEASSEEVTPAGKQLADQISRLVGQGRVFTPAMLAIVIREYIRESPKS